MSLAAITPTSNQKSISARPTIARIFFDPRNNFFYLQPDADGPPLKLPTWHDGVALSPTCRLEGMKCDGRVDGELGIRQGHWKQRRELATKSQRLVRDGETKLRF
jgi:hypothetical protein